MRQALIDLIKETIIYEYELPNDNEGILKTIYTHEKDHCFRADDPDKLAEIIYNAVIDYANNEYELSNKDLNDMLTISLKTKLKYNADADESVKIKYGFFGEVLLFAILVIMYEAMPLIARGYFYNPLENAETKGYDSYQLVDNNGDLELWFGEVKFHINANLAIDSVMGNIEKALSNAYLESNVLAMYNHRNNLSIKGSKIEEVLNDWETNPSINIPGEMAKHNMTLVYPILLLYQKDAGDYHANIRRIPDYILQRHHSKHFSLQVPFKVFFILLPLEKVKEVKQSVISWIESKKPLIS